MFLSVRHRLLFVHIAKTGGSSIRRVLKRHLRWRDPYAIPMAITGNLAQGLRYRIPGKLPRHSKAIMAKEMLAPGFWDELFKFVIVRNPWDLQVSAYHYLKRDKPGLVHDLPDFDAFVRFKMDRDRQEYRHALDEMSEIQSHYVTDMDGSLIVDFIGRFERLKDDFAEVCRLADLPPMSLPHEKKSTRRKEDYRTYYTAETAELVAAHYAEDIERFGYSFDP
jgi:hypothetical protein